MQPKLKGRKDMRMNCTGVLVRAMAGVSILSMASPAFAASAAAPAADAASAPVADEPAPSSFDANQIIVSARRRDERLQDVPVVVNVVSSETLNKLNLRNFADITAVVPGLALTANANGIGTSSSLRGVNQDVNVSGENGTIQYYLNDAPIQSNLAFQALYDVSSINVERGPQGTLRGRSTPSGAINITTHLPDLSAPGGYVSGTVGDHSIRNIQFGIGTPIIADKLAVRISGLQEENDAGGIRQFGTGAKGFSRTRAIRAQVRFAPVDWFKAGFLYQGLNTSTSGYDQVQSFNQLVPGFTPTITQSVNAGSVALSAPFPSAAVNDGTITANQRLAVESFPRQVDQTFRYFGWNGELDFAGQRLIYVGSRYESKLAAKTNQDGGGIFPTRSIVQDTSTKANLTTHEVRLQNQERVAGIFDYVVGYFFQKSDSTTSLTSPSLLRPFLGVAALPGGNLGLLSVQDLIASGAPLPSSLTSLSPFFGSGTAITLPYSPQTEKAFFGNVTAHIGEATEISGGLRTIHFVNNPAGLYISCTPAQFAAGSCTLTPGTRNIYDLKHTIYSGSIKHRFTPSLMVYASTGTSYRPPVRAIGDFSASYSPLEVAHTALNAETSRSYEIGLKSDFINHTLFVDLTGYHQTYQNYPFRSASGVPFISVDGTGAQTLGSFNFISAVPVRVNGVEAEIAWRPSRSFSISTVTNYSDSKVGNTKVACVDANKDGINDSTTPTLSQLQAAYAGEHLAECPAGGFPATFLPKISGSVTAEASYPVGDKAVLFGRGLMSWRGKSKNDPFNALDNVGAYALFNFYAGIRAANGAWDLTFFVKNAFNTTKLITADPNPLNTSLLYLRLSPGTPGTFGSANYQSNYSNVSVTAPRQIGVTARFAFGAR